MNNPPTIVTIAQKQLVKKATSGFAATFISAIFAGAMIGAGFIFYVTTQVGAATLPYGVAKTLGGVVFSAGLAMVVLTGADLFTSTTMTTLPLARGKISARRFAAHWGVVYAGNFIGALALAAMVFLAGTPRTSAGQWGAVVVKTAITKVSHTPVEAFFLGILCNIFVCLAVWVSFGAKTTSGKIAALTMPVALFVATGFEHSVANMFMIPLGLMVILQGNPEILGALGDNAHLDSLNVSSFFFANLVPVTLGNMVGGGIIIALGMLLWQRKNLAEQTRAEVSDQEI